MVGALSGKSRWWRPAVTGSVAASLLLLALPLCPCAPPSSAEGHGCCAGDAVSIEAGDCCAPSAKADPAPLAATAPAAPPQAALAADLAVSPLPLRERRPPLAVVAGVSFFLAGPPLVLRV